MRIAYVVTRADSVGGATIHVRDLACAMLQRGHQPVVLVGGTGPVTEQFERAGIPFRALPHLQRAVHPIRDCLAFREMARALHEIRPALVSTHTAKAGWIGRAVCARLGLPCIYTPHGWTVTDRISPSRGFIYGVAEKVAASWTSAIVCVCEYERKLALARNIARPDQLFVVHNGVRDVGPELRARPGTAPVRIVSVARFEAPKDHRTLLEALSKLRALDWELDLVGDGPLEGGIRRLAGRLGMGARVHFLGYQAEPAATLARGHIFVLSTRSEGFPRSILEAMRAGLPVVASDAGGISEAIEHGRNGLLAPRGDADALASALNDLISDGLTRQRLGDAAHLSFVARFRLDAMIEGTAAVYTAVLGRHTDTGTFR